MKRVSRLDQLIIGYLTGDILREDLVELERHLTGNVKARERFVELAEQEIDIRDVLMSKKSSVVRTLRTKRRPSNVISPFSWRRIAWVAVAAAAALIFGLFNVPRAPRVEYIGDRIAWVEEKVGDVKISGNKVSTGSDSACMLEYGADTFVALDQRSEARLHGYRQAASKVIELDEGRIYVDAAKQIKPLFIKSGDATVEVLGTKLLLAHELDGAYVNVLGGVVQCARSNTAVFVGKGYQVGPCAVTDLAARQARTIPALRVTWSSLEKASLSWLKRFGIVMPALPVPAERKPRGEGRMIDFDDYRVVQGLWELSEDGNDVVITQHQLTMYDASILFGKPRWTEGAASFKFRILEKSLSGPSNVGILFYYQSGYCENFGTEYTLKEEAFRQAEWIHVQMKFKLQANGTIVVQLFNIWPDNRSQLMLSNRDWRAPYKRPEPVEHDVFCIGLNTLGCAVEFRDLRLTDMK